MGAPLGQLPARAPAGRRGRRDHALELPAAPDRREGRPRAGRRLHGRAQAVRARAGRGVPARRGRRTRSGCRRACSTWSPAPGRSSARRSCRTRRSTWCRSPAPPAPAAGSPSWPRPPPSAPRSSSAARAPRCCSTTCPSEELGDAVAGSLTGCLINSGQTCSATTRLLVPRDRLAEVEGLLEVFVQFAPTGDPLDPATQQGPLVSKVQQERVRGYIRAALDEGAKLVAGGPEQPESAPTGFFVTAHGPGRRGRQHHRAGGGLRAGPHRGAVRRRRRAGPGDRERHAVRAVRRRLGVRPRPGGRLRAADAHRPGRRQRRRVQPDGAVRRVRAERLRPRARARSASRSSPASPRCSCSYWTSRAAGPGRASTHSSAPKAAAPPPTPGRRRAARPNTACRTSCTQW